ncbi:MAG: hypothetical protein H6840_01855 [Planctomycetes bacterium]|nr:hypothetical protein [Planctomycetota bacterium]
MSGKNGLIIGLLAGMACGLFGVILTMHLVSSDIVEKQSAAYSEGLRDGLKKATADGLDISDQLNQGMANENAQLVETLRTTRTQLEALQGRDDLTPQAKDQIAGIIAGLQD